MLKQSASVVLAARRGSTYRSVRLASLLAAALLDGLFEHPVGYLFGSYDSWAMGFPARHSIFQGTY
jgi:hypothetical protein